MSNILLQSFLGGDQKPETWHRLFFLLPIKKTPKRTLNEDGASRTTSSQEGVLQSYSVVWYLLILIFLFAETRESQADVAPDVWFQLQLYY